MPVYMFHDPEGNEVTAFYSMAEAPKIGDMRVINGQECRRVPSFQIDAGVARKTHQYPYLSNRLPTTIRGCELKRGRPGGRLKPEIRSRNHELEVMAQNDLQRDGEGV
jgi:hypothetical protein